MAAESISYAVCQYFGIQTNENNFGYIASWSQGKERKEMRTFQDTLKAYARRKDKDLRMLMRYAKLFRVEKILRQYLEVLL